MSRARCSSHDRRRHCGDLRPGRVPARVLEPGEHANTTVATWQFGDDTEAAELHVKPNGRLAEVRISRWGNPGGAPFRRYPFGVRVEAESRFGGITIPSVFRAAWHESEFFRAEITGAVFS